MSTHNWTKSSYSPNNGGCVEFKKRSLDTVGIRDSKVPDGERLAVTSPVWTAFVESAKSGQIGHTVL